MAREVKRKVAVNPMPEMMLDDFMKQYGGETAGMTEMPLDDFLDQYGPKERTLGPPAPPSPSGISYPLPPPPKASIPPPPKRERPDFEPRPGPSPMPGFLGSFGMESFKTPPVGPKPRSETEIWARQMGLRIDEPKPGEKQVAGPAMSPERAESARELGLLGTAMGLPIGAAGKIGLAAGIQQRAPRTQELGRTVTDFSRRYYSGNPDKLTHEQYLKGLERYRKRVFRSAEWEMQQDPMGVENIPWLRWMNPAAKAAVNATVRVGNQVAQLQTLPQWLKEQWEGAPEKLRELSYQIGPGGPKETIENFNRQMEAGLFEKKSPSELWSEAIDETFGKWYAKAKQKPGGKESLVDTFFQAAGAMAGDLLGFAVAGKMLKPLKLKPSANMMGIFVTHGAMTGAHGRSMEGVLDNAAMGLMFHGLGMLKIPGLPKRWARTSRKANEAVRLSALGALGWHLGAMAEGPDGLADYLKPTEAKIAQALLFPAMHMVGVVGRERMMSKMQGKLAQDYADYLGVPVKEARAMVDRAMREHGPQTPEEMAKAARAIVDLDRQTIEQVSKALANYDTMVAQRGAAAKNQAAQGIADLLGIKNTTAHNLIKQVQGLKDLSPDQRGEVLKAAIVEVQNGLDAEVAIERAAQQVAEGLEGRWLWPEPPKGKKPLTAVQKLAAVGGALRHAELQTQMVEARGIVAKERTANPTILQRQMGIDSTRARQLLEMLEKEGTVSAPDRDGIRDVLREAPPAPGEEAIPFEIGQARGQVGGEQAGRLELPPPQGKLPPPRGPELARDFARRAREAVEKAAEAEGGLKEGEGELIEKLMEGLSLLVSDGNPTYFDRLEVEHGGEAPKASEKDLAVGGALRSEGERRAKGGFGVDVLRMARKLTLYDSKKPAKVLIHEWIHDLLHTLAPHELGPLRKDYVGDSRYLDRVKKLGDKGTSEAKDRIVSELFVEDGMRAIYENKAFPEGLKIAPSLWEKFREMLVFTVRRLVQGGYKVHPEVKRIVDGLLSGKYGRELTRERLQDAIIQTDQMLTESPFRPETLERIRKMDAQRAREEEARAAQVGAESEIRPSEGPAAEEAPTIPKPAEAAEGPPVAAETPKEAVEPKVGESRDLGAGYKVTTQDTSGPLEKGEIRPSGDAFKMRWDDVELDPGRFQYKISGEKGQTAKLKNVKIWEPSRAGVVMVWRDPADGKVYVTNGHQRVGLAERLNAPWLRVLFSETATAEEARVEAALINIGEGSGTVFDAAKFFRETGATVEMLEKRGVPLTEAVARDGLALARLSDELFNAAIQGKTRDGVLMKPSRAVIIGSQLTDHGAQRAVVDLLAKKERSGRSVTNDELSELVRLVKESPMVEETGEEKVAGGTQVDLFKGLLTEPRSAALEKAEVSAFVKNAIMREKRIFGGHVAKETSAEVLSEAGNIINSEENAKRSSDAAKALEIYDKLSTQSGQISDVLNDAARQLAEGGEANAIKQQAYRSIRKAILTALKKGVGKGIAELQKRAEPGGGAGEKPAEVKPAAKPAEKTQPEEAEPGIREVEASDIAEREADKAEKRSLAAEDREKRKKAAGPPPESMVPPKAAEQKGPAPGEPPKTRGAALGEMMSRGGGRKKQGAPSIDEMRWAREVVNQAAPDIGDLANALDVLKRAGVEVKPDADTGKVRMTADQASDIAGRMKHLELTKLKKLGWTDGLIEKLLGSDEAISRMAKGAKAPTIEDVKKWMVEEASRIRRIKSPKDRIEAADRATKLLNEALEKNPGWVLNDALFGEIRLETKHAERKKGKMPAPGEPPKKNTTIAKVEAVYQEAEAAIKNARSLEDAEKAAELADKADQAYIDAVKKGGLSEHDKARLHGRVRKILDNAAKTYGKFSLGEKSDIKPAPRGDGVVIEITEEMKKRIDDSYSGDLIPDGKVRKPFVFMDKEYVCVAGGGPEGILEAFRIVPKEEFEGDSYGYYDRDFAELRADPNGFYDGMEVKRGKKTYVLQGPRVYFRLGPETGGTKGAPPEGIVPPEKRAAQVGDTVWIAPKERGGQIAKKRDGRYFKPTQAKIIEILEPGSKEHRMIGDLIVEDETGKRFGVMWPQIEHGEKALADYPELVEKAKPAPPEGIVPPEKRAAQKAWKLMWSDPDTGEVTYEHHSGIYAIGGRKGGTHELLTRQTDKVSGSYTYEVPRRGKEFQGSLEDVMAEGERRYQYIVKKQGEPKPKPSLFKGKAGKTVEPEGPSDVEDLIGGVEHGPEGKQPAAGPGRAEPRGDVSTVAGGTRKADKEGRLVVARAEHTDEIDISTAPQRVARVLKNPKIGGQLAEHQKEGVVRAGLSLSERGGFLLADGTGAGKTRQILAVAEAYRGDPDLNRPVLIVAPAEVLKPKWGSGKVSGSYEQDARAMGIKWRLARSGSVEPGEIVLTTYQYLKNMRLGNRALLVFDESHALKNAHSIRHREGMDLINQADNVMFATATPADKPTHIMYLERIGILEGKSLKEQLYDLGMILEEIEIKTKSGKKIKKQVWVVNPRVGSYEVFARLSDLFDRMTKIGAEVKREITWKDVPIEVEHVNLGREGHETLRRIEDGLAPGGIDSLQGLAKARVLMHMRLQQEPYKIKRAIEIAKEEVAAGRQVVIFAQRVNYSETARTEKVYGFGGEVVDEIKHIFASSEGTAKQLRTQLEAAGITKIGELHGGVTKTQMKQAMEDFQKGRTRVLISTVEAGGVGVNLDDVTGNNPRTMLILTPPFNAMNNVQAAGRVWRMSTKSKPRIVYLFGDTKVDRWNASLVADKMKLLGATVKGEVEKLNVLPGAIDYLTESDYPGGETRTMPNVATARTPQDAVRTMAAGQTNPAGPWSMIPKTTGFKAFLRRTLGLKDPIVSRQAMIDRLVNVLQRPIRIGRVPGSLRAIYKQRPEVIRSQIAKDIVGISHEVGHHIAKLLWNEDLSGLPTKVLNELDAAGSRLFGKKKPSGGYALEGFAEFLRAYQTDPGALPRFFRHTLGEFETIADLEIPEIKSVLLRNRADWEVYEGLPAFAKADEHFSFGEKSRFRDMIPTREHLYSLWVDRDDAIRIAELVGTGGEGVRDPMWSPWKLAQSIRSVLEMGNVWLKHDRLAFRDRRSLDRKPFNEIVRPIEDTGTHRMFGEWLAAARITQTLIPKMRRSKGQVPEMVQGMKASVWHEMYQEGLKKHPWFERVARELYAYQDDLLKYLRDSGVVSKRLYGVLQDFGSYVPLYKLMDVETGRGRGTSIAEIWNPVQRIGNSGRTIIDPLESIVRNTYLYMALAERNRLGTALGMLADREGAGRVVERIAAKVFPHRWNVRTIKSQLEEVGIDVPEDALNETLTLFRPNAFAPETNVFRYFADGKPQLLDVSGLGGKGRFKNRPSDLWRALNQADEHTLHALVKWLSKPTRALRFGAVGTPSFAFVRNPVRDIVTAFVLNTGYRVPVIEPMAQLVEGIYHWMRGKMGKGDKVYETWLKHGGSMAAEAAMDRRGAQDSLDNLLKHGLKGRTVRIIKHPIDSWRQMAAIMEEGLRLGRMAQALRKGTHPLDAALEARSLTLDFGRAGAYGKYANQVIAFWNANVQEWDKMYQAFRHRPISTAAKVFAHVTVPSLLLEYAYRDDPDYQRMPAWMRNFFWPVRVKDKWIFVPKPHGLGILFGSIPQNAFRAWLHEDPSDQWIKDSLMGIGQGALPGIVPTAVWPVAEIWANWSQFLERPVVPGRFEKIDRSRVRMEHTTDLVYDLTRFLNKLPVIEISAPAVEHGLYGYFSGVGRGALESMDWVYRKALKPNAPEKATKPLSRRIPLFKGLVRESIEVTRAPIERVYDHYKRAESAVRTLTQFPEDAEMEAKHRKWAEVYGQLDATVEQMAILNEQRRDIAMDPDLNAAEKRRQMDDLYREILKAAEEALADLATEGIH